MSRVWHYPGLNVKPQGGEPNWPIPFVVVGHVEEPCYDLWSDTSEPTGRTECLR